MPHMKAGTGQKHIIALHFFDEESNIVRKHTCSKCSDTKLRHLKILRWHDKKWAEVYDIALLQTEWKWQIIYGNPDLDDVRRLFINTKILIPLFLNCSSSVRQFVIRLSFRVAWHLHCRIPISRTEKPGFLVCQPTLWTLNDLDAKG